MTFTTNTAAPVHAPSLGTVLHTLATPFRFVWNVLCDASMAGECARKVDFLSGLSDAELDARGLKREDIVRVAYAPMMHY